jgi:hypothetical protein
VADLAAAFAGTSVPWAHADQVNTTLPVTGRIGWPGGIS